MSEFSEGRKVARELSNFLKKVKDAEEIFAKAEEVEAAIPGMQKKVQEAETEAMSRMETARAAKAEADRAIAEANTDLDKTERDIARVQAELKNIYQDRDEAVKVAKASVERTKADSEKQLNEYVKMAEARIADMQKQIKHWDDQEKAARKAYEDFIEKTTGKKPSPPPVTGTVAITLDPVKISQALKDKLNGG